MAPRNLDDETLAALIEGRLPAAQAAALRRHLGADRAGAELLDLLAHLDHLESDPSQRHAHPVPLAVTRSAIELWPDAELAPAQAAAARPLERLLRVAVRWLGAQLEPLRDALAPEPALAVQLRGAAASSAQAQPLPGLGAGGPPAPARDEWRWRVQLGPIGLTLDLEVDGPRQVALTVRPDSPPPAGTLLRLIQGSETRALSTLGIGGTTVGALEAGRYALTLEGDDREIGRLPIDLHAETGDDAHPLEHKNGEPRKNRLDR